MSRPDAKKLSNEQAVRYALAVTRGIQLINPETDKGKALQTQFKKVRDDFESIYNHIHAELFVDWKNQGHLHQPGKIENTDDRTQLRLILEGLLVHDKKSNPSGLLYSNGSVRGTNPEELSVLLADTYHQAIQMEAFGYGNRTTLDFFLTALFDQKQFQQVAGYKDGLDFQRLTAEEKEKLHDRKASKAELQVIFEHALDDSRTPQLENSGTDLFEWPGYAIRRSGMPFLAYRKPDNSEYVVTVNGGLVPLKEFEQHLKTHMAANPPHGVPFGMINPIKTEEYLPGTEHLRKEDKLHIDGIPVQADHSAIPLCLDVNILTGLRKTDHDAFVKLFHSVCGDKQEIFYLNEQPQIKGQLLRAAVDDRQRQCVEIACRTINYLVPDMDAARDDILQGKTKHIAHPQFFMSQGGASAGKTSVENLAEAECGTVTYTNGEGKTVTEPDCVVASLDQFRGRSDLYSVLQAANHHSDDYKVIEPMANALRDWVKAKAVSDRMNLLYDGTGIEYKGRYDKLVKEAKEAGYVTHLGAVDAKMDRVFDRIVNRFQKKSRAVPWDVVLGKHFDFPKAFMESAEDKSLNKITLFANDTHGEEAYLMAETFKVSKQEVEALNQLRAEGKLAEKFAEYRENDEHAATPKLQKLQEERRLANPDKAEKFGDIPTPQLKEDNVSYFSYSMGGDDVRLLAIYDVERFTQMIEKSQKNRYSSTQEGIDTPPLAMKFAARVTQQKGQTGAVQL